MATGQFLVVIGSYERILYGIDVKLKKFNEGKMEKDEETIVKVSFAIPAHSGMIKSIAINNDFLATGSTDDTIRLFDIKKRKEIGALTSHSSPIISMEFLEGKRYLMAAETQGRIAIYNTKDWECIHVFKGGSNNKSLISKKNLVDIACHPSSKLFMALSQDGSLKCWDLKKAKLIGRERVNVTDTNFSLSNDSSIEPSVSASLPSTPKQRKKIDNMEKLKWSPSGKYYAVLSADHLLIYQTKGNEKIKEWNGRHKMTSCLFYNEDYLFIVGEGSRLDILNVTHETDHKFMDLKDQTSRIKDLKILDDYLITGSSSGVIAVWKIHDLLNAKNYSIIDPILQHSSSLRITCIDAIKTS